ncbi:MAG: TolC family protein [Candidatus Didemnitutus sp.]|nr:TolC family protein [Candidatus Didemnitutus sp.]
MKSPRVTLILVSLLATGLLAGCATRPIREERVARDRVSELARLRAELPTPLLQADNSLEDYLRFSLLRHPRVAAAHADWRAAVEAITPARSLPDPKLTFEADIADMVMTLMPGLMFDLMGPGKRAAMGREAAAESDVAYQRYRATVLQVAADVKKTWADLAYLDTALALRAETLTVLDRSLAFAQADYTTGKGMGTLEAQVNAHTETERIRLELANLADQRDATRARFKAALGLRREESPPPWPKRFPSVPLSLDEDALWAQVLRQNPELGIMRAMVGMAVAEVGVARKARVPDIEIGVMADLKADPLMVRPTAAITLPIWRDKIAATIAASENRREAAAARLSAEEINLAAELAQMSAMIREAGRMIDFIDTTALPGIERALDSTRSGYQAGMASLSTLPSLELMALGMRLEKAAAERERARAFADLSLLVTGAMPDGAPVLAADVQN